MVSQLNLPHGTRKTEKVRKKLKGKTDLLKRYGPDIASVHCARLVSDIAIFVLKRDVKLQLTNCARLRHSRTVDEPQ